MKLRSICKSKIHRATVTGADIDYIGSIAIDVDLLDRVDLWAGEKVHVWDVDNGERFETYAIPAPRLSGEIVVNGAAARRVQVGHRLIIVSFVLTDEPVDPLMIIINEFNRFGGSLADSEPVLALG